MGHSKFGNVMFAAGMLLICGQAWAADAGIAKKILGDVRVVRAGTSTPLKVGDPLQELDRIIVAATGSAGLTLKDETLISLGPNSTFVIDSFAFDAKTNQGRADVSIVRGAMRYVTGLIAKLNPAAVSVSTTTVVMGVRGTEFIVETTDEK
ncbi:MAG: FecR domain-containing protein [Rhodocyclaceae bacterium]|nr:FecR domain-containing protein [Rhodocyclaceae bacterium]MBL0074792.1 FecR domain-containing protein [Rhodocyclaceae bacterium]MBP6110058.1 FecR domain-containing protein [Rhodocyclaceae bacterium]MBP6278778.1 FecR domain-containing protein [Rhodocyclaceae bacterium]